MKYIMAAVALFVSTHVAAICPALTAQGLSAKQQYTLIKSFEYGRAYDLSYSLAAIAWKESSAGEFPINVNDPSYGVHGILITNALVYAGLKDTSFNRNKMAIQLVRDETLSAKFAVINLRFWQKVHGNDWRKIIASYNAGYNTGAGSKYAADIARKVRIIRQCRWE